MEKLGNDPNETGYSIWKNNDEELVAKIKAMKPKTDIKVGDTVNHWRIKEAKVVSFINEKELLVYSEKLNIHDVHRIEDKEGELMGDHLQKINDKFDVKDYFTNNFGIISNGYEIIHGIGDRMPNQFRKETYDEVRVGGLIKEDFTISTYNGVSFKHYRALTQVSCYFNEDGNYVNRDYNLDLEQFTPCDPIEIRKAKIDEYINEVVKHIGTNELYHSKGVWFTNRHSYHLDIDSERYELGSRIELSLDAKPNQGASYYHSGESAYGYRKPKKYDTVEKETLLDKLRSTLVEHYEPKSELA